MDSKCKQLVEALAENYDSDVYELLCTNWDIEPVYFAVKQYHKSGRRFLQTRDFSLSIGKTIQRLAKHALEADGEGE